MIAFILENSADPDEMTHSAAFHLAKVPNRCFLVSSIQMIKHYFAKPSCFQNTRNISHSESIRIQLD